MKNFVFHNPTEILFGIDMIAELGARIPSDTPVLLLYGGGSIKKNGVYDQVVDALGARSWSEFGGIEANPDYDTSLRAVEQLKAQKAGFILAVGGGSVLDAAKFIAVAACGTHDDPWRIVTDGGSSITEALPIGAVLTLPATGSESNGNSVISRRSTKEKRAFGSQLVFPRFSVLDPTTTFTLPRKQVRNGVVDTFSHVIEQYMTGYTGAPLQDRFSESIIQTLVEVGRKTLDDPEDYDARAAFMWSATLALNKLIGCGVPQDWSTHMIGHELTALYGLDHAETLAIVMPGVWRFKLESKNVKLAQYATRVWGASTAEDAIEKTEQFFASLEMPTTFGPYGIDAAEAAEAVKQRFEARGVSCGENDDINGAAAAEILSHRA
ncbi:MAG: iron-containing alcohol dehydrogenase [Spirochaetaceae bacterium]|nr:MAG: iron-containing alcohol dehydrogenase [Spirochaetaceae bacterium]